MLFVCVNTAVSDGRNERITQYKSKYAPKARLIRHYHHLFSAFIYLNQHADNAKCYIYIYIEAVLPHKWRNKPHVCSSPIIMPVC